MGLEFVWLAVCDGCNREAVHPGRKGFEDLEYWLDKAGWSGNGNGPESRWHCPDCTRIAKTAELVTSPARRGGFTLVELLVVIAIVGLVSAVTIPAVVDAWQGRTVKTGAELVKSVVTAAQSAAQSNGGKRTGLRFLRDESFPLVKTAAGTIAPSQPIAYDRAVPLFQPDALRSGRVAIHHDYPAGTTNWSPPALGVTVLEQEIARDEVDPTTGKTFRMINEPTAWEWCVRLGDRVEVAGRIYTVCGPVGTPNVEGFINYTGLTPLIRSPTDLAMSKQSTYEYLLLVDGEDGNGDGIVDNGYNGIDDDYNGVIDNIEECVEVEQFAAPYDKADLSQETRFSIKMRPAPVNGQELRLGGAVIDATGALMPDAKDRTRSRVSIDPYTGSIDVEFTPTGVQPILPYSPTAPRAFGSPFLHLWITDRGSVQVPAKEAAVLLSINGRTGQVYTTVADPAKPLDAFQVAEAGGQ
jgi:prepilin-type N-terminal cleavage/methylation domain-containing protein